MLRQIEIAHDVRAQLAAGVQRIHVLSVAERFGHRLAAGDLAAFEHEHLLSRLGEIVRRDQAVEARADDDDVVIGHRYFQSFSTSCAASLPAAPITPPPGCAPDAPK